jgi:hypothetical protein
MSNYITKWIQPNFRRWSISNSTKYEKEVTPMFFQFVAHNFTTQKKAFYIHQAEFKKPGLHKWRWHNKLHSNRYLLIELLHFLDTYMMRYRTMRFFTNNYYHELEWKNFLRSTRKLFFLNKKGKNKIKLNIEEKIKSGYIDHWEYPEAEIGRLFHLQKWNKAYVQKQKFPESGDFFGLYSESPIFGGYRMGYGRG